MRALTDYIKRMMDGKAEEEDALKPEDMDTRFTPASANLWAGCCGECCCGFLQ